MNQLNKLPEKSDEENRKREIITQEDLPEFNPTEIEDNSPDPWFQMDGDLKQSQLTIPFFWELRLEMLSTLFDHCKGFEQIYFGDRPRLLIDENRMLHSQSIYIGDRFREMIVSNLFTNN